MSTRNRCRSYWAAIKKWTYYGWL